MNLLKDSVSVSEGIRVLLPPYTRGQVWEAEMATRRNFSPKCPMGRAQLPQMSAQHSFIFLRKLHVFLLDA